MSPQIQWITLLWMLFSGAALGVAYDSYRVLSGQLHFPKWTLHVLDVLYWSAAALFVFRMLYISNYGQLRFYVFVGLFIGVWLYFLILSVTTQRFVVMLIRTVRYVIDVVKRLFRALVWAPIRAILKLLKWIAVMLGSLLMFLLHVILRCLTPFWKLLQWMLRPITSRLKMPEWFRKFLTAAAELWKRWFSKE
ncbi:MULTISPECIES: spore cortex biosynthesis protein YabQ [Paenibacillus]|uniref:spore cortex biosynthesis protein YabQ n=1 Tax=Paenibacillus TaxID=44249 RepID=UPI0011A2077F|nr:MULTISPECIES: spore cortex biosynthesis protein YabQ [Paenibacillus]MBJ9993352.1 spore cortex biosynthesis protein YabQ [Paenibacillus sp. S28]MEC0179587.1 spore cortex biosynthesis protein YabQ [Paenibacillus favisporus]